VRKSPLNPIPNHHALHRVDAHKFGDIPPSIVLKSYLTSSAAMIILARICERSARTRMFSSTEIRGHVIHRYTLVSVRIYIRALPNLEETQAVEGFGVRDGRGVVRQSVG